MMPIGKQEQLRTDAAVAAAEAAKDEVIAAKDEVIAAKDAVIAAKDARIAELEAAVPVAVDEFESMNSVQLRKYIAKKQHQIITKH